MARALPVEFDPIRKQLFVENLILRMDPRDAAVAAGFTTSVATVVRRLLEDEDVQAMIEGHKAQLAQEYDVSKERVLRDLVDAKEMARTMADPKAMIMGLKEISDVQGHHAPKQMAVEQRVHHTAEVKSRIRMLPEDQLLELAEEADFVAVELLPTVEEDE